MFINKLYYIIIYILVAGLFVIKRGKKYQFFLRKT